MRTRPAQELLYDSEALLRLVDNAIGELGLDIATTDEGDASASSESCGLDPACILPPAGACPPTTPP
jgi:hypothetical protein